MFLYHTSENKLHHRILRDCYQQQKIVSILFNIRYADLFLLRSPSWGLACQSSTGSAWGISLQDFPVIFVYLSFLCTIYVPFYPGKNLSWQKRRIFPFINTPSVHLWHWETVEVGPWPAQWLPWHNEEAEGNPTLLQSASLYPVTFMWPWCHATLYSCLHHHLRNPADFGFPTFSRQDRVHSYPLTVSLLLC